MYPLLKKKKIEGKFNLLVKRNTSSGRDMPLEVKREEGKSSIQREWTYVRVIIAPSSGIRDPTTQ